MPHATLVVAGATRRQVLETERDGSDLPVDLTGVEALGWVDDEEKVAHLGEAEIVCAPSLAAESFGIVLAEAWPPACRSSPRTCPATARCCATARPGG